MSTKYVVAAAVLAFLGASALAADPASPGGKLLAEPGKALFADNFDRPLGGDWRTAKGKWEVVDGVIRGAELKADMHGAVTRHAMPFRDVVIEYAFKLDGTRMTTLSINDAKGHVCRVLINDAGFTVRKDDHDHTGPDQAAVLDTCKTPIKPGEWHTMRVEIVGREMLACLDGKQVAFGTHAAIDVDKTNFGLTVAGESASFKDLKVWAATPAAGWETTKRKLLAGRPKP